MKSYAHKPLTFDCPNCLTHYELYDGKEEIGEVRYSSIEKAIASQLEYGFCKKCKRTDGIRTTFEMDGLFTQRDLHDRFYIMKPCLECAKYTKQDLRMADKPCVFCGGEMGKSSTYWNSLRTFKEGRKLSAADRKKMGA